MSEVIEKRFKIMVIKNADQSYCFKRITLISLQMKLLVDPEVRIVNFRSKRSGREDWHISVFATNLLHYPLGEEALTLFTQAEEFLEKDVEIWGCVD